ENTKLMPVPSARNSSLLSWKVILVLSEISLSESQITCLLYSLTATPFLYSKPGVCAFLASEHH
ncbi:hypothetical protein KZ407_11270, partial [Glaesserella parasuis]|nr:hypothetical protein [Glaesserella parasuis]